MNIEDNEVCKTAKKEFGKCETFNFNSSVTGKIPGQLS
jgi:hypothetical protein